MTDIWVSAAAGVVVIAFLLVFHRELLIVSFDRVAGESMGIRVFWIDLLLLLLISLTIVISLRAVGNILVVAMLVTPAATARLLTDRLPAMVLLSSAIGVLSGISGLLISYHADVAAGGTIVLVATGVFGLVWLFAPEHGFISTRLTRRRISDELGEEATVLFESPQILPPSH
jgi:manganese/iron transport system permease protein